MNLETMTKDEAIEAVIASLDSLPDDLSDADITRTAMQIRRVCGNAYAVDWTRAAKGARKATEAPVLRAPASLAHIVRDAPDGLEMPPGYIANGSEVWQGDTLITRTLCVIVRRLLEGESVHVEIAWIYLGAWRRAILPRSTLSESRKITALSDRGLDVTSGSASLLVAYLAAFEGHNTSAIPYVTISPRCGWIAPDSFLRGRVAHGEPVELRASAGLAKFADGIREHGDPGAWDDLMHRQIARRPALLLAVYVSLAAPLLEVVGAPGFVVDWSGPMGRGKSTALDAAMSVWGDPGKIRGSWDISSAFGPQSLAAFLCHLPLFMDDTNKADQRRPEIIAQMLYVIPSGESRIQGTVTSEIREIRTWRTVMLSTGEQAITSYAGGNAGAKRRALCIRGAPMGAMSAKAAADAGEIQRVCSESHGHAGARFIAALLLSDRSALRARHAELVTRYQGLGSGSTDRSFAPAVASIELASEIARDCGVLGVDDDERQAAITLAWSAAVDGGEDSDEPLSALRELWAWCVSNEGRMQYSDLQSAPTQGWIGMWDPPSSATQSLWAVDLSEARRAMENHGRRSDYCLSEWARRGLIRTDGKRMTIQHRRHGRRIRLLTFDLEQVGPLIW